MNLKQFLILVEPRSKILSILPCWMGIMFTWFYFGEINVQNSVIYFVAALLFDATTSALNNVMDYYKATTAEYQENSNLVGRNGMNPVIAAIVVITMLVLATGLGLYLVYKTGWLLLLLGMFCFGVGIFYTFGPLPLSRLPLGEVFSGFTMGVVIPVIAVLVNVKPSSFVGLIGSNNHLLIDLNWPNILATMLICVLPVATIAGVELANNLSDYDEDLINKRKTLAMYISKSAGLKSYQVLVYIGYFSTILAVILHVLPWPTLFILVSLPKVISLTKIFLKEQHKQRTFHTSLIIAAYEMGFLNLGLLSALIFKIG